VRLRFREVEWRLIVPLLAGMFAAIFAGAAIIEPLLTNYPTLVLAFFIGLIVASLRVPYRLAAAKWRARNFILASVAAVVAGVLTSLPQAQTVAVVAPWQIALGAALAVCALVLPGVSGSFLLLALGLYAPTLAAVNDRDWGYLAIFVAGALVGLGAFVNLLRWLLANRHEITLTIMTGLMAGSVLALWPWGRDGFALAAPPAELPVAEVAAAGAGLLVVAVIAAIEQRRAQR
jgi:putative membrane protein